MSRIGMLGASTPIEVAPDGAVRLGGSKGTLRVWIGDGDGWHDPAEMVATRQHRESAAPIIETRTRVARGDVSVVAYGSYVRPDTYAIDIVNRTADACGIALVVEHMPTRVGDALQTKQRSQLVVDRGPRDLVAAGDRKSLWSAVTNRDSLALAEGGVPIDAVLGVDPQAAGSGSYALLYPLPHGATLRVAMVADQGDLPPVASLPDAATVASGWRAQMNRGLRVTLPNPRMQQAIDASRIDLLLEHATANAHPDTMIALEDWGFDSEAADAFNQLGFLDRRRVVHRPVDAAPWNKIENLMRQMTPTFAFPHGPAEFLNHVRSLLAFERPDGTIDLMTHYPVDWIGQSVDVHDAPTRGGTVSYSIRWHGNRAALLWECEQPGLRLHVPGLDPLWMTSEQQGEALLAPYSV